MTAATDASTCMDILYLCRVGMNLFQCADHRSLVTTQTHAHVDALFTRICMRVLVKRESYFRVRFFQILIHPICLQYVDENDISAA